MPIVLKNVQYRLSRVYTGGNQDYITYNRVIFFSEYPTQGSAKFVEGFGAKEYIIESYGGITQYRKQTSVPVMLQEFEKFRVIGSERILPQIRSWISFTTVPAGFDIDYESDIFSCKLRDIDASHGDELNAYNSTELGTDTGINFYDRDVRIGQRNIIAERAKLTPTPAPESIADPIVSAI